MAAFGSLEHIFDKPFPENQAFLESLSPWKHIRPSSIDESSITEIFGELHFKENNHPRSPLESPPSWPPPPTSTPPVSLCTEGLGFESFDDVEDLAGRDRVLRGERRSRVTRNIIQTDQDLHDDDDDDDDDRRHGSDYLKRSRICRGDFPPPVSCIGRSGKPWVCFKSYRQDGRFVLKEIRIPTQEFMHACREDGRLRLQFIHSDDEIFEYDDDCGDDDDDDDKEENFGVGSCDFQIVHDLGSTDTYEHESRAPR